MVKPIMHGLLDTLVHLFKIANILFLSIKPDHGD